MRKGDTSTMRSVLLVFVVTVLMNGNGLASELRFSRLNKSAGLSQGSVTGLAVDSSNFLWIGTEDGLNRFDGHSVTAFRSDPSDINSIQDNVITALAVDGAGRLWVGSEADGISTYQSSENNFARIHPEKIGRSILSIYTSSSTPRTAVKTELGLFLFDENGNESRLLEASEGQDVLFAAITNTSVVVIKRNGEAIEIAGQLRTSKKLLDGTLSAVWSIDGCKYLLLGTSNDDQSGKKLYCHHNGVTSLSPIHTTLLQAGISVTDNEILAVVEDNNGIVWISTLKGLLQISDNELTVSKHISYDEYSLSSNKLSGLLSSGDTLFVGTEFDGLNLLYTGGNSFPYFNLQNSGKNFLDKALSTKNETCGNITAIDYDTVWSILEDSDGDLWVGNNAGLAVKRQGSTEFEDHSRITHAADFFDFCSVWSLAEADGLLWAGIWGGLVAFDKTTQEFTHIKPIDGSSNDTSDDYALSGKFVRILLHDEKRNSLWIGTNRNGLNRLDLKTNVIQSYAVAPNNPSSLPHGRVRSLFLDSSNRLWVGTGGGLSLWDEETDSFTTLSASFDSSDLSDEDVRSISEAGNGYFWIGTGNGIDFFNSSSFKVEERLNTKDGLSNSTIYAMVEDDVGNYWVTTAYGLNYFKPSTREFEKYSVENGLQSNEFNFNAWHKTNTGEIYVGGVTGVNSVSRPTDVADVEIFSPAMTKITVTDSEGQSIVIAHNPKPGAEYKIEPAYRMLEFEYTVPSYSDVDRYASRYKLGNTNTAWSASAVGPTKAIYTNVSAGRHVFDIGLHNSNIGAANYSINVNPYLYERIWFQLLLGAIGFFLISASISWCNRKRVERSLEEQTQQHFRILEHEIRPHVFQANANLNTIINSTNLHDVDKEYIENSISPLMNRVVGFLNNVRHIVDFQQALREPRKNFMLEDVVDSVLILFSDSESRIVIDQLDDINVFTHEDAVYLILSNLISNALKYSEDNELVHLKLAADESNLYIECIDNGIGISPNKVQTIYQPYKRLNIQGNSKIDGLGLGLNIIKQIVHTYNGNVYVSEHEPRGSRFQVVLKEIVHRDRGENT